ncbi:hypothetical protein MBLNU230_g5507t1 [Neophaeotheca triangularis]
MASREQTTSPSWAAFPTDLPVPVDDGACDHLTGLKLPSLTLKSTSDDSINLSTLPGLTILFCYPRTGGPNETVPETWNSIPGARGCTPQACSFRDNFQDFKSLGVSRVFGVSTQDTAYQREIKDRVHLPYDLLSDEGLEFVEALGLPTFEWEGRKLSKRLSMVVEEGIVRKVWYPVFPPSENARQVRQWLENRGTGRAGLST